MAFFNFLQIFEWRNWNCFLGKWGKAMKSKLFFGKVRQSNQNCLNSKLATKSILHNSLKLPWGQKGMLWAFGHGAFDLFANFWVTKLKLFSGKVRQSIEDYLNPKLVIGSISEICFEATLRSKTNVLGFWKKHFSLFWNFWMMKFEAVYWKSAAKC